LGNDFHDLTSVGEWSTFDLASLDARATGYVGGVFDGRYVYLVPLRALDYHGFAARYDTQAPPEHAAT
jgi:hypothetical protein